MARLLLFTLLLVHSASTGITNNRTDSDDKWKMTDSVEAQWAEFKDQHNKTYETAAEIVHRAAFAENLAEIEEHNKKFREGKSSFEMGLNEMSDWTPEEYAKLNGFRAPKEYEMVNSTASLHVKQDGPTNKSVDWTYTTPEVKDQGQCGSCYSFAGMSALESQNNQKKGKKSDDDNNRYQTEGPIYPDSDDENDEMDNGANDTNLPEDDNNEKQTDEPFNFNRDDENDEMDNNFSENQKGNGKNDTKLDDLSEQNIVDCSTAYGNQGCNGGLMTNTYDYVLANGGVNHQADYPYEGVQKTCRYKRNAPRATIKSYVNIPQGDEAALADALYHKGAIAVAVDASHKSFQHYRGGIYSEPACTKKLDHAVTLVGSGVDANGKPYWIIKNSWGTKWGINGFMRFEMGVDMCGIAQMASYPVI